MTATMDEGSVGSDSEHAATSHDVFMLFTSCRLENGALKHTTADVTDPDGMDFAVTLDGDREVRHPAKRRHVKASGDGFGGVPSISFVNFHNSTCWRKNLLDFQHSLKCTWV